MTALELLVQRHALPASDQRSPEIAFAQLPEFPLTSELASLLRLRNGFLAFDSALHVFPLGGPGSCSLLEWNQKELWKVHFEWELEPFLCFAEDLFGEQFCLTSAGVGRFNPERGELTPYANSLKEWASLVLEDPDVELGRSLAQAWQIEHGTIDPKCRLIPRILFDLGGEYAIANLVETERVTGMKIRGQLASKLRGLPDGTVIRFNVVSDRPIGD